VLGADIMHNTAANKLSLSLHFLFDYHMLLFVKRDDRNI